MVKAKVAKEKKAVRFVDNQDNTITDQKTGLLIIQDPTLLGEAFTKTMTFDEMIQAIRDLNKKGYAGYNDWRPPSVEEICGMIDRTKQNPCYDKNTFKGKFNDWYWSGEPCGTGAAWCVYSYYGSVYGHYRLSNNYVRPVRSSQSQFDPLLVR